MLKSKLMKVMIIFLRWCFGVNKAWNTSWKWLDKFSSLNQVIRVDSANCFHTVIFTLKSILQHLS